jgi:signal transduction histidine kinase
VAQEIERPGFIAPSIEPLLDPGWSRLLRLVRPPIEAAYAQLRRLSTTALTPGQKTLLKMAAASIAGASDSLSSIELVLEDGPAPATSSATPVLEAALAAWEPAFRRRGVGLHREWSAPIPEAAHDPKALRIIIHHVLRNVLEAVNRGGRLTVRAGRGADGALNIEFLDDGPGFPAQWLERRFEPFAAPRRGRAGLGLSLVRRTLRRWGGEAEAGNVASGHGARLILLFAPPPAPSPTTAR